MRIVAFEADVFKLEGEDVSDLWIEFQGRQRACVACELQTGLFEVVAVKMRIAKRMYEVAYVIVTDLRQHMRQQCVGGNVEGHAQKNIRATLVELARESAASTFTGGRGDIKLEQRMSGR